MLLNKKSLKLGLVLLVYPLISLISGFVLITSMQYYAKTLLECYMVLATILVVNSILIEFLLMLILMELKECRY